MFLKLDCALVSCQYEGSTGCPAASNDLRFCHGLLPFRRVTGHPLAIDVNFVIVQHTYYYYHVKKVFRTRFYQMGARHSRQYHNEGTSQSSWCGMVEQ